MIITEKQLQVLEFLAQYRYLTSKQLYTLGLSKSEQVIRNKALAPLKKKPLSYIKSLDFGFYPSVGKLHNIHHLTKKGVSALIEMTGENETILFPKGKVQFTRDYFHRVSFIDIHIALRQWAEKTHQDVLFFHSYFDSNQAKKDFTLIRDTQVSLNGKTIVPDGNFSLKMIDGEKRLFSVELHRGNNIKVILRQLYKHTQIIEKGLLSEKYAHDYDNYVLSVYEDVKAMEKVKSECLQQHHLEKYKDYIAFNTLESTTRDFSSGWHYADNQPFKIFNR